MKLVTPHLAHAGLCAALAMVPLGASAQDQGGDVAHARPFKWTVGYYQYRDDEGKDINLRWQHGDSQVWLCHYEEHAFGGAGPHWRRQQL